MACHTNFVSAHLQGVLVVGIAICLVSTMELRQTFKVFIVNHVGGLLCGVFAASTWARSSCGRGDHIFSCHPSQHTKTPPPSTVVFLLTALFFALREADRL